MTDKTSKFAHFNSSAGRAGIDGFRRSRMSAEERRDESWGDALADAGVPAKSREDADADRRAQLTGFNPVPSAPRT